MNKTESVDAAVVSIEKAMSGNLLAHQAAAVGLQLHKLQARLGDVTDRRVDELLSRYLTLLSSWGLHDLLQRQTDYAIELAGADGALEYEEMHKLFSLCDEIFALESLGLKRDVAQHSRFEAAVRQRLSDQLRVAQLVAEDRREGGSADSWWIAALSN